MIALQAVATPVAFSGASGATITLPGSPNGQLLVAVFAFESVAAGSGPWVTGIAGTPLPAFGWQTALVQDPAAAGAGLQVLNTYGWSSAQTVPFTFDTNRTGVGTILIYTGQYSDGGVTNPVRASSSKQVAGSSPSTPTILAFTDEMLLAVAADTLAAPGFGTPNPAGSTQRVDANRAGFGTAEVTAADYQVNAGGTLGPFLWPATASPSNADGATAVLAIRPAAQVGESVAVMDAPLPPELDLGDGWTVRVTALSPADGSQVAGVTVSKLAMEVALGEGTSAGDLAVGPYLLVPGSGA